MAPITRKSNRVAHKPTANQPTALRPTVRRPIVRQPIFTKVMTELNVSHKKACMLCGKTQINEKLYGPLYQLHDVVVHYFCILLSSRAAQNGTDKEGIWGFLFKDIKDEVTRGSKQSCFYCNKKGATILCCGKKCRKQFHLPCGLKNGSMHQYFQSFKSFCQDHRIPQIIDLFELQNATTPTLCAICKDNVKPTPSPTTLWAPCCKHNAWFHRECVQDLALSSGYFFRCPLCNNVDKFKSIMLNLGIYIPSRDASWETVPNAFAELSERHNTCNAINCQCPHEDKRKFHQEFGSWKLILCHACGSNGTHGQCSAIKCDQEVWYCSTCQTVADKEGQLELPDNKNCSGNSVVVFEERASSQNGEIFQRQNSEIILNEAQSRILDSPILISDDSNDSSVKLTTNVEPSNTDLQVDQTPQIRLPIISSYGSLNTSTRNYLNHTFFVPTNQSICIDLVSEEDDSE